MAALQTKFQYFAEQLNLPIPQRDTASLLPPAVPLDELEKRTYRDSLKANALNELWFFYTLFHVKHILNHVLVRRLI